jgi:hypothetical protein
LAKFWRWEKLSKNFQRVRVDFALANPLLASVRIKVRGHGWIEFIVKYESVPFFCLCCGRIGHQDREFPDEEIHGGEARYDCPPCFSVQSAKREETAFPGDSAGAGG